MAFNIAAMADYTQSNGQVLISDLILGGESFNLQGIGIQQGIKYVEKLEDIADDFTYLQSSSTGDPGSLSFSGGTKISDVDITVHTIYIKEKYLRNQLEHKCANVTLTPGTDPSDPIAYAQTVVSLKQEKTGYLNDILLWQGDSATGNTNTNTNKFDGIYKLVTAGSYVSGATSGALVSGTCLSVMNTLYNVAVTAFPIWEKECYMFLSPSNFSVYYRALFGLNGAVNNQTLNITAGLPASFVIPGTNCLVQSTQGLTGTNYKFITRNGNFVWGTDLVSEDDTLNLKYDDSSSVMGWRLFGAYKLGAQVARIGEVVLAE